MPSLLSAHSHRTEIVSDLFYKSGECESSGLLLTVVVVLDYLQATFFTTYVLSSGWASLSCEVIQLFALLCNVFRKFILGIKEEPSNCALTFPHHTEIPRLLLFGLIGFTCSVMAPLILPFLLVYFFLAFLVYRNQVSFV